MRRSLHPSLPRVELHWRVHWYERRFAADALVRAQQSADGAAAADGAARRADRADAVLRARRLRRSPVPSGCGGVVGSSAAKAPTVHCARIAVIDCYPELAAPVRVASNLLAELVDVPV